MIKGEDEAASDVEEHDNNRGAVEEQLEALSSRDILRGKPSFFL